MLVLLTLLVVAEPTWQSQGEHEGIALWQRPGQGALVEFRARTRMPLPLSQIAAVVWDIEHHAQWSANCQESLLLERRADGSALVYIRVASPFPLQERDVVYAFTPSLDGAVLQFALHATADARKPLSAQRVRMTTLEGSYRFAALGPTQTEVTYQILTDPAGNLPTWAVNWGSREVPINTLKALLNRAQSAPLKAAVQDMQAHLPQVSWDAPAASANIP